MFVVLLHIEEIVLLLCVDDDAEDDLLGVEEEFDLLDIEVEPRSLPPPSVSTKRTNSLASRRSIQSLRVSSSSLTRASHRGGVDMFVVLLRVEEVDKLLGVEGKDELLNVDGQDELLSAEKKLVLLLDAKESSRS